MWTSYFYSRKHCDSGCHLSRKIKSIRYQITFNIQKEGGKDSDELDAQIVPTIEKLMENLCNTPARPRKCLFQFYSIRNNVRDKCKSDGRKNKKK